MRVSPNLSGVFSTKCFHPVESSISSDTESISGGELLACQQWHPVLRANLSHKDAGECFIARGP